MFSVGFLPDNIYMSVHPQNHKNYNTHWPAINAPSTSYSPILLHTPTHNTQLHQPSPPQKQLQFSNLPQSLNDDTEQSTRAMITSSDDEAKPFRKSDPNSYQVIRSAKRKKLSNQYPTTPQEIATTNRFGQQQQQQQPDIMQKQLSLKA
jgi:hypothetical protein